VEQGVVDLEVAVLEVTENLLHSLLLLVRFIPSRLVVAVQQGQVLIKEAMEQIQFFRLLHQQAAVVAVLSIIRRR
jgi:hypothetical protein